MTRWLRIYAENDACAFSGWFNGAQLVPLGLLSRRRLASVSKHRYNWWTFYLITRRARICVPSLLFHVFSSSRTFEITRAIHPPISLLTILWSYVRGSAMFHNVIVLMFLMKTCKIEIVETVININNSELL